MIAASAVQKWRPEACMRASLSRAVRHATAVRSKQAAHCPRPGRRHAHLQEHARLWVECDSLRPTQPEKAVIGEIQALRAHNHKRIPVDIVTQTRAPWDGITPSACSSPRRAASAAAHARAHARDGGQCTPTSSARACVNAANRAESLPAGGSAA